MKRLFIAFIKEEYDALRALAAVERRDVRKQIAHMAVQALPKPQAQPPSFHLQTFKLPNNITGRSEAI